MNADAGIEPGALVADRYRLTQLLGEGGMGAVFEARDERQGRTVALKLLTKVRAGDAAARERFVREVDAPRAIGHPGIAAVLDSGEHAGMPFLAMERLRGCDLDAALRARGPLSAADAVRAARAIGATLVAVHAAGIVHRDLKPRNVFLVEGRAEQIKILDFGVAKWLGGELELTGPAQVFGTPAYMAPEQLYSSKQADLRADLYALGATLFAMLAGRPPFVARSEVELYLMIANDPPPDLRALRPDVPEPLAALVARALKKAPAERPASAAALLAALAAAAPDVA